MTTANKIISGAALLDALLSAVIVIVAGMSGAGGLFRTAAFVCAASVLILVASTLWAALSDVDVSR